MSSDYIPRLRSELLRAGASRHARWRPARVARGLRPLAAAATVAASVALVAVALVLAWPQSQGDERPATDAVTLSYRVEPPSAGGLGRHSDPVTGVAPWWEPFEVEFEWDYPGPPR